MTSWKTLQRFHLPAAGLLIGIVSAILLLRYPYNYESYRYGVPWDFGIYAKAWERASLKENPYILEEDSPFKYSPGILAVVGYLPPKQEQGWFVFSTLCISALAISLIFGGRFDNWKRVGALALGVLLAWKGIIETFDYGQAEVLIFALAVLAGALLDVSPFLSGFLVGTLPWIKPPWIFLLLPLILRRKGKGFRLLFTGYGLSCFFWGMALPTLVFGSERAKQFFQSWLEVLRSQPEDLFLSDINQSLWVSALRWLGAESLSMTKIFIGIGLVCILSGFLISKMMRQSLEKSVGKSPSERKSQSTLEWISPWLLLIQLLSPLSWRWGSVFLIGIPYAFTRRAKWLIGIALALWLLQQNPVAHAMGYGTWKELHYYGMVTLYWMTLLLMTLV